MFVVPNHICLLVALLMAGAASADEPIKLYMPEAPPLTLHHYEGGHGMVGDVVLTALARIGKLTHIVVEPWPRAQVNVARGKNMLITLGENPVHLLTLGRIDAWFTGVPEALYIWDGSAYREQNLRRSPTLASTGLYLGCSKECDGQLVEQLRAAINELEQDGVSQRLRQAYLPLQPDP
ncbi:MAG: amino acid ABC transporter substrate-binding protein [Gammaproteobacteria bacterium HGW-Gammaproteobacteria-12]|nr:MAG: amino acid ABC transporter substrate-binding protein [Gammaproteobacteria bacterium HGW-Gammaproteobacteria-12]